MEIISVETSSREVFIDITGQVSKIVKNSGIKNGICKIFIPHTTAAVTINENADPSVQSDIIGFLKILIPRSSNFAHIEGNSDAHVKSSLVGCSEDIIIKDGSLALGTWQGIYFAEFDGPRTRKAYIKLMKS